MSGTTILELLVALSILAILTAVVTTSFRRAMRDPDDDAANRIRNARAAALASGSPVTMTIPVTGGPAVVTAFPDGSIVADSGLNLNRLTGARDRHVGRVRLGR